jgi:hypothetical protein|tara:strand:- start:492 stop:611 length:120 start_codon:yes stop_codon:yes gene_type:complete
MAENKEKELDKIDSEKADEEYDDEDEEEEMDAYADLGIS